MRRRRAGGWVLMEATVALGVIVVLIAGMHVAGAAEAQFARDVARRDAVRETAEEILERARLTRGELAPGAQRVDVDIDEATATRTVRERSPGLLEVEVTVRDGDFDATLTTLITTETAR